MFAVDASTWDRCDAETSPERGFYYSASKHSAGQPIVAGWSTSGSASCRFTPDSWTAPLDVRRIPPPPTRPTRRSTRSAGWSTLLDDGDVPMFVFDAGYDPIAIGYGLADVRAQVCAASATTGSSTPTRRRVPTVQRAPGTPPTPRATDSSARSPRPGPSPPATSGHRPIVRYGTRDRHRLARHAPQTLGRGRWAGHRCPPIVSGSVIRVEVEHLPKPTARTKKTLWLWWSGPGRARPRSVLARLPAPLRHRAHLPVRQEHPRLDHPVGVHPRPGRPLDVARRRRAHPAPPGPRPRRRPPPPLGTTTRSRPTHPRPNPSRVSPTSCTPRHARQTTETHPSRTRPPQRHPKTTQNPLPRHQERPPDQAQEV